MSFLTACGNAKPTTLLFIAKYQGERISCDQSSPVMWYLSNFKTDKPVTLVPSRFADETVVLLGGDCANDAWQVQINDSLLEKHSISFDMAVPFELNHLNPLTAGSPLNISEMFWSWQLGHKFLRFDGEAPFAFHLGSTGCKSASRLRAPEQTCTFTNRYRFTVSSFNPNRPITFDLDMLFAGVEKSRSCMSEQDNPVCKQLFANLQTDLFYQE